MIFAINLPEPVKRGCPYRSNLTQSNRTLPRQTKKDICIAELIAAMTYGDTEFDEIKDCLIQGNQKSCKAVSRQFYAHWNQLRVNKGCILLDNNLTITNVVTEAMTSVLHVTNQSAWSKKELARRQWWPFNNRDLINKSITYHPRTEFGKTFKSVITEKRSPLKQCVEPNEEIQIDFGGAILDGKARGREVYFHACIGRFLIFTTLKLYNNANSDNIEHFWNQHITPRCT